MIEVDGRKQKQFQILLREDETINPKLDVDIFQLNVLRRRHDSETVCNQDLNSNVDIRWRETIMNKVKCIPTYWKNLEHSTDFNHKEFEACSRSNQYSDLYDEISYGAGEVKYEPSCTSATMTKIMRKGDLKKSS